MALADPHNYRLGKEHQMVQNAKPKATPQEAWAMHAVHPTSMLLRDWVGVTDLNEQLKNGVWRDRALDPEGLYRSNQAGTWHSKDRIFERLGDAGKKLWSMFGQGFMTYATSVLGGNREKYSIDIRMSAWAMVYSGGGYAAVHTHPNCHVSGVYYVSNDTETEGRITPTGVRISPGDIEFVDTRRGGEFQVEGLKFNPTSVVKYADGRMIVFPSWLPHYVHPIVGSGERIAIACNATFHLKEKTDAC